MMDLFKQAGYTHEDLHALVTGSACHPVDDEDDNIMAVYTTETR